jgi:tetratricopeptide (TPR) repeat protein
MRPHFAYRSPIRNESSVPIKRAGSTNPPSPERNGKLAFAMLLVFLLTFTIFYEWKRATIVGSGTIARRETIPQTLDAVAQQCIVEGEYIEAIVVSETLLEAYPESALAEEALFRVGLCWLCLDNELMAVEAWERLLKLYPDSKYAQKVRQGWLIIMKDRPHGTPV